MTRRPRGLPDPMSGLRRTVVMGVLNVTPDSFSDGGRFVDPKVAVEHGIGLHRDGADVIDVGGESTRPGAERIPLEEELRRVIPVVSGLVSAGVPVSIDTMRAATAEAAVMAGACIVNDVSGGLADPGMCSAVAGLDVPFVIMHWRGHSDRMAEFTHYADVVTDVIAELAERIDAALAAGIDGDTIVIDPGLGFAKEAHHNWELLNGMAELERLGYPVLIGASRKRFLGSLLADGHGVSRPLDERNAATDAITAIAAMRGTWGVRVHDVRGSRDAVRVAAAWQDGSA